MTTSLVAVSHEITEGKWTENDKLMSSEVQSRFVSEVLPQLTDKSLILVEGFRDDQLIYPARSNYDYNAFRSYYFGDALGSLRPTFGGFDPRYTADDEAAARNAQRYDQWGEIVTEVVEIETSGLNELPSLDEIIALTPRGRARVTLKRRLTREERQLVRTLTKLNQEVDQAYIKAIRTHGKDYDHCIFVGGPGHVVPIAIQTGHPAINLVPIVQMGQALLISLCDRWLPLLANKKR